MTTFIIFLICIVLFVLDIFPPATISIATCVAMVLFKVCSMTDIMSGFTSDIVLLIFGTEIFGLAFNESGLASIIAKFILKASNGKEKRVILIAGFIAALLSAFLNNQVVSSLMLVICINISKIVKQMNVKNITLPIIFMVIFGGQCTLIGAPATLIASSISTEVLGKGISMFELLPMGLIILVLGTLFIYFFSYKRGLSIWGNDTTDLSQIDSSSDLQLETIIDKKKIIVTIISGVVMLFLFITELVSVGIASVIAGLICIFGGVIKQKFAFEKLDWNILIWLGCSISIATQLNNSGSIQFICEWLIKNISSDVSPILLLVMFVLLSVIVSNFISNTTTVMIILPFALQFADVFSLNPRTFLIGVTMASGLAIMTPLSCGFIGMTTRLGYKFKDYIKYGFSIQILLTILIIILTMVFYPIS